MHLLGWLHWKSAVGKEYFVRSRHAALLIVPALLALALCGCGAAKGNVSGPPLMAASIARSSAPSPQSAASADAFVDSIGVNTHLTFIDHVYYTDYPAIDSLLVASGIRHIRDGAFMVGPWYGQRLNDLAGLGVKSDLFLPPSVSDSALKSFAASVSPAVERYEGPNELDGSDPSFAKTLQTFVPHVAALLKADPRTAKLPFIAPSFETYPSYAAVGSLAPSVNYGNIHNYYGGYNPGTGGWGAAGLGGNYGSLSYAIAHARLVSLSLPIISTETGYCDGGPPNASPAPQAVVTRYLPRLFLEQFFAGISRTYLFEFADEPGTGTFTSCGLLTARATPKPQYAALKNLITLLSDKGPAFQAGKLSYGISGITADTRQAVLEKRNGTFYLAIWQEVLGAQPGTTNLLTTAPQSVHISFNPKRTVTRYAFTDQGDLPVKATSPRVTSLEFPVDDHVTILQIR